jgi:hypothetical protein
MCNLIKKKNTWKQDNLFDFFQYDWSFFVWKFWPYQLMNDFQIKKKNLGFLTCLNIDLYSVSVFRSVWKNSESFLEGIAKKNIE